jgi:DNA-directed RNA polymerase sigma subunit (sigma70/sigma32)
MPVQAGPSGPVRRGGSMILSLRYGLHDGRPRTLEEVARRVGLTRERVRQLEKQALVRLRAPESRHRLLDWAS